MITLVYNKRVSVHNNLLHSVYIRDCEDVDAPRMKNIGYVLSGYDIYHGNPILSSGIVDPGFRSLIFAAEYNGDTTPDYRYCTPDGLSLLSCFGNCDLSFNTDEIYGTYSYNEKLSGSFGLGVEIGVGDAVGKFGASIGWSHVEKYTENGSNIFTQSEAHCCAYTTEMFEFVRPKFHRNFIAGLETLTEHYNKSEDTVYRR